MHPTQTLPRKRRGEAQPRPVFFPSSRLRGGEGLGALCTEADGLGRHARLKTVPQAAWKRDGRCQTSVFIGGTADRPGDDWDRARRVYKPAVRSREWRKEFLQAGPAVFSGLMIMPVGLAIVLTHNIWAVEGAVIDYPVRAAQRSWRRGCAVRAPLT